MRRSIGILICLSACVFSTNALSQNKSEASNRSVNKISFKTQFIQIKDEFNYGLVYSGINLAAAYTFIKITEKSIWDYNPEIAFGATFNKGAGFSWRFKPIDLYYGRKLKSKPITIGAYFATDYQWQQYSELQGGRLFWFSVIEVGPKASFRIPLNSFSLDVSVANSLMGFTSRPEPSTETYYYSFNFSEFVSVAHQNLTFGSYGSFNRTKLEIEMQKDSWKRFSIGYSFEYFGYYNEPTLSYLNNSINMNCKLGKL